MWSCGGAELSDARHPTGSQTIAASADYSALYAVNTQEGSITRLGMSGGPANLTLEGEPTRVARAGDRVFVSLRAKREVAVLEDDGAALREIGRVKVGHEPYGVVANEAGTRVYVASSLSNTVQEIDASSLAVLREFEVEDEPRWLALSPRNTLFVGSAWKGSLFSIALDAGTVEHLQLPQEILQMNARITGDMAFTPDGDKLLVPSIYADTTTPVSEPDDGGATGEFTPPPSAGYAGEGTDGEPGKINPSVTIIDIDGERPSIEDASIVAMRAFGATGPVGGYASSVVSSPDGDRAYAAIEGADVIIVFELDGRNAFFESGLFESDSLAAIPSARGVRGIAFRTEHEAAAHGFLDRTIVQFNVKRIMTRDPIDPFFPLQNFDTTVIEESNLAPEVELGRSLFYATNDQRMALQGGGVSCATCHFEGRTDGLSWSFDRGARQTPSLAGKISLTAPVRWEGDRETVAIDAMRTSQGLMGGVGLTENESLAIEAFLDSTRDVDSPLKNEPVDAVARGRAIFERTDVGCYGCHSGERYTNNAVYSMFGMPAVKTRSLVGLAGSPPYLHDGSVATIEDLLQVARTGVMGNTSALSDSELSDLAAFLRSL